MIAGGSTPGRGPYGQKVSLALDYVLANQQQSAQRLAVHLGGKQEPELLKGIGRQMMGFVNRYGAMTSEVAAVTVALPNPAILVNGWLSPSNRWDFPSTNAVTLELRTQVMNEGKPSASSSPNKVSVTASSTRVKPRAARPFACPRGGNIRVSTSGPSS